MTDPRWTPEIEQVVAGAMLAELNAWPGPPDDEAIGMAVARAAIAALADAGLLVPRNARTQHRVVYSQSPPVVWTESFVASTAEQDLATAVSVGWPDARIQTRIVTDWTDVETGGTS